MVKNKLFLVFALILAIFLLNSLAVKAQMVGLDGYIQGSVVEIGIRGLGGFEGVDQSVSPPPAGYHARTTTMPFGFIANPQLNLWAGSAYDGDFFTPGAPENGWGVEIGTTGISQGNNGSGGSPFLNQIPGTLSLGSTFNCLTSDWEGDLISGTNLHFKISWLLHTNDLFYTTTISITNNTSATIPDMYYYRNVDPDNNQEIGGGFTTTNTIVSQPGAVAGCDLAHVSATAATPWSTYLGFAAIGPNWRADYGGFANRDASDLWTGTGFTQTVGSSTTGDIAISLAYRIQNLAPGATEIFNFVTILASSQIAAAINDMINVTYPSSTGSSSACNPDTILSCAGAPVPISLTGAVGNNFSWSWSPAAGLSTTTGSSVIANPTVTTTYTATGTPLAGTCAIFAPVTISFVIIPTPIIVPVTGFSYLSPVCLNGSNPVPITVAGYTPGGVFTASPTGLSINSSTGVVNLASSSAGTYVVTCNFVANICNPASISTYTLVLLPVAIPTLGFTYSTFCASDTSDAVPFPGTGFTTGGTYTSIPAGLVIDAITGVVDVNNSTPGTYTVTYSVVGSTVLCTASGSGTGTITINPLPTILTGPEPTVWVGDGAWLYAMGGSSYSWSPTQYLGCPTCDSTTATPPETTEYCVTVTSSDGCIDSACVKVNVEIPCPSNRNLGVPNAFSPNNDGVNDAFCLNGWGDCISKFEVVIFDRWGEKVYESKNPDFCWDGVYKGKSLDPAVFVYFIKASYETAGALPTSVKGVVDANRTGNISLVR